MEIEMNICYNIMNIYFFARVCVKNYRYSETIISEEGIF